MPDRQPVPCVRMVSLHLPQGTHLMHHATSNVRGGRRWWRWLGVALAACIAILVTAILLLMERDADGRYILLLPGNHAYLRLVPAGSAAADSQPAAPAAPPAGQR